VTSFVQQWLGERPHASLTLLDLPEVEDAPFEAGAMLAAGIQDADPEQLKAVLVHGLAHAWVESPGGSASAWPQGTGLDEGLAYFLSTVWMERQQGREKALEMLESGRSALALAEPASPGQSAGEPLAQAASPVYYRTKAAYVLWMLRGMTSDDALSAALRGDATVPLETRLEKAANTDLKWFFADWVDADKGLPDLSVGDVFSSAEKSGNWLVAVRLANGGYAGAEVPVTVRTADTSVTQRVQVPGRGTVTPRILIQGKPTDVQVNDGTVPETGASVHVTKMDAGSAAGQKP
jgi:aminopeptidase N